MHRYIFGGRVNPERTSVSIPRHDIEIGVGTPDVVSGTLAIEIICGQVHAELQLIAPLPDGVPVAALRSGIQGQVALLVDAFAYLQGWALDVELSSCVDPQGVFTVFAVDHVALQGKEGERPVTFDQVASVAHHLPLKLALADLRLAMRYPTDTEQFAFRCIESVRQHFVELTDEKQAASWERLRTALRVDRAWIASIQDQATARRHGAVGHAGLSTEEHGRIIETARKVVDRFCLFLLDASAVQQLPELRP
jgi:hypothetical protein